MNKKIFLFLFLEFIVFSNLYAESDDSTLKKLYSSLETSRAEKFKIDFLKIQKHAVYKSIFEGKSVKNFSYENKLFLLYLSRFLKEDSFELNNKNKLKANVVKFFEPIALKAKEQNTSSYFHYRLQLFCFYDLMKPSCEERQMKKENIKQVLKLWTQKNVSGLPLVDIAYLLPRARSSGILERKNKNEKRNLVYYENLIKGIDDNKNISKKTLWKYVAGYCMGGPDNYSKKEQQEWDKAFLAKPELAEIKKYLKVNLYQKTKYDFDDKKTQEAFLFLWTLIDCRYFRRILFSKKEAELIRLSLNAYNSKIKKTENLIFRLYILNGEKISENYRKKMIK